MKIEMDIPILRHALVTMIHHKAKVQDDMLEHVNDMVHDSKQALYVLRNFASMPFLTISSYSIALVSKPVF